MNNLFKIGIWVALVAIILNALETAYFGFNMHPICKQEEQWDNVIEKWDSMGEAGKKYGHHSKIVMCCLGTRKTAYGYKWKLV